MEQFLDSFNTEFGDYPSMLHFHEQQAKESRWMRCKISDLQVEPLDAASPLMGTSGEFAPDVERGAVEDTAKNLGLALRIGGELYPLRDTANKSLLDRAKINGTALPKLSRAELATVLNYCLQLFDRDALILIRDEKVSAVHSGDETDYSILPIDQLLTALQENLDQRFAGNVFEEGYADHSISSGAWKIPGQREGLIGAYIKMLEEHGQTKYASRLVPGIRFITSDTGVASAKVSALILGGTYPMHIGSCVAIDHRHQAKVSDFVESLDQLFAQFCDGVAKLQKLLEIRLNYPVNAMTRVCKKLCMPKKEAVEAIRMFEMAYGTNETTAHEVYVAMQEILFTLKTEKTPQNKILSVEENMARALSLRWKDYDLAKPVDY